MSRSRYVASALPLTMPQLRALHAAALWSISDDGGWLDDWMKAQGCGRNWPAHLRRAIEVVQKAARR